MDGSSQERGESVTEMTAGLGEGAEGGEVGRGEEGSALRGDEARVRREGVRIWGVREGVSE